MERYICVHGHFYQPPRENPWLETIELQDSAYPYHDWNERITAECYSPNGISRILDAEGYIIKIVNNYAHISFNFGPTLLSWLEHKAPHVYKAILEADIDSQKRFSGHGSALAQVYNHMIMPLANARDKQTQVLWGLFDFKRRFGRDPEGMWLAETAVDIPSLEVLAEHGIKFTILAPHQASRVRKIGGRSWKDISGARIDPTQPYLIHLPSGRTMTLFFYDGPISRAVAFERLLNRGEFLAERLLGAFNGERTWPQLVHIATDGETYGHHHRYGDMALAYALDSIAARQDVKLTNYGEYLERFAPTHEVEIFEESSWSCAHGVERWRSDCGCNSGRTGWNQAWRAPLRQALDWLRDTLAPQFEEQGRQLLKDPWEARNAYIDVVFDRSPSNIEKFANEHAARELNSEERIRMLKLLEMQRQAMLMYTSCGWFFDELSGIETVQVIQYAGRAVQLAEQALGQNLEGHFVELLSQAPSNRPEIGHGGVVYEKYVKQAAMDMLKVGAHFAISSLFQPQQEHLSTYCYKVVYDEYRVYSAGKARLAIGKMDVVSSITTESGALSFAIIYFGDHNLNGGVRFHENDERYASMIQEITDIFNRADFPETLRFLDKHFNTASYSLKTLFRDEQRAILNSILGTTLSEAEGMYRQIYENNVALMRFLADSAVPLPKALQAAAEFVVNMNLRHACESDALDLKRIDHLIAEAKSAKIQLDVEGLAFTLRKTLWRVMDQLMSNPSDLDLLRKIVAASGYVWTLPFAFDFWKVQNLYHDMIKGVYPQFKAKAEAGDESAKAWLKEFLALGEKVRVRLITA